MTCHWGLKDGIRTDTEQVSKMWEGRTRSLFMVLHTSYVYLIAIHAVLVSRVLPTVMDRVVENDYFNA